MESDKKLLSKYLNLLYFLLWDMKKKNSKTITGTKYIL